MPNLYFGDIVNLYDDVVNYFSPPPNSCDVIGGHKYFFYNGKSYPIEGVIKNAEWVKSEGEMWPCSNFESKLYYNEPSSFGKKKPPRREKISWGYAVKDGEVHRVYLSKGKEVLSNGKLLGRHTTYKNKSDALKELKHTKIGKKYTKKVKMNKNYVGEYYKKEGRVRIFDRSILKPRTKPCAGAAKWRIKSRYWMAIVGWVKVTQNKFKFKGKTYYVNTGSSFGKKPQKRKNKKTYKGYTLVSIKKSTNSGKKLMATFKHTKTGRTKTVHFGFFGMSDFLKHGDPQRKQRYINRHRKRENWRNPMTAGALSLYILWNKPTLKASIADYKRRFF